MALDGEAIAERTALPCILGSQGSALALQAWRGDLAERTALPAPWLSRNPRRSPKISLVELATITLKLSRSENLPVLPQVVGAVLHLADNPNSTLRDYERVIGRDPAIMAKLLRVVNSAQYALEERVTSVGRALAVLGQNAVKSLVLGVAYQQMITGRSECPAFSKLELWQHSLAVGTIAQIIGGLKHCPDPDGLYAAGIMHDVGLLVMDRFAPDELAQAILHSHAQAIPIHEAEEHVYGFNHAQIGALLADRWGLAGPARTAIEFHHEPTLAQDHAEEVAIIALANQLAHRSGYTNNTAGVEPAVNRTLSEIVGMPEAQFDAICQVASAEVQKTQDAYAS